MKTQIVEKVSIAQAHNTVVQAAKMYFSRDARGNYRVDRRRARPVCLMGPAGIGKTEIVRQAAQELDVCFLSYSVTHHTRQSAIGLPKLVEGTVDGKRVPMTEYTMSEIVAQVWRIMEETGKSEGILFLDEFNCASESLRPIMLQLLQDKSFGPHRLPDGWMLVLAGNPAEYNKAASDLDPVTADRLRMVHIAPDYPAWRSYAVKKEVHPVVLSYLDNHKEDFYICTHGEEGTALATARGWEDLSVMLQCLEAAGEAPDLPLVAQYIQAGNAARSFFSYWQQYGTVVASGLLDCILAREPKAVTELRGMSFERSWSLVAALLQRLRSMAENAAALDATTAVVHEKLAALKDALKKEGQEPDTFLLSLTREVKNPTARTFLERCALVAVGEGGWEAVKETFASELRQPRNEAYQAAAQAVSNTIAVCRKGLEGKPHLEFLFNALCDSRELMLILSEWDSGEFRRLFEEINFDPAAAQALRAQMNKAV